jgi:quercetin dioxygenase-like cupin family protein
VEPIVLKPGEGRTIPRGTLCLQLGDEEIEAPAGTFVPRGTPHTFRNTSPQPVRFLGVHSPGIEHMLIALAQATTPQEIGEISARFDSELA